MAGMFANRAPGGRRAKDDADQRRHARATDDRRSNRLRPIEICDNLFGRAVAMQLLGQQVERSAWQDEHFASPAFKRGSE